MKIKRSLTNSPISVQFSDGYATWSALCENFTVNDQHVDTRTKWMIQVVILCMTYIITRQKLSGGMFTFKTLLDKMISNEQEIIHPEIKFRP